MSGHRSCRGATDASIDAIILEEFQVAPGCLDSDSASDVTYGARSARTQSVRPPGPNWGQVSVNQAGQRDKDAKRNMKKEEDKRQKLSEMR